MPDPCSRTFELNHTVEPWSDKEMRWALNYAIDRDEIVAIAYEGSTFKSEHFFPAYPPLNRYVELAKDAGVYDVDRSGSTIPIKAKEIIESKGYTMGSDGYYAKDGTAAHAGHPDARGLHREAAHRPGARGAVPGHRHQRQQPQCGRRDLGGKLPGWATSKPAWAGRPAARSMSPGRPWTP